MEFFDAKIRKENGPLVPLEELLYFPLIFKPGDVVSYRKKDGNLAYYYVVRIPDYDKDVIIDNSDESYLVLNLGGGEELLNENGRFSWHSHLTPINLEQVYQIMRFRRNTKVRRVVKEPREYYIP